MALSVAAVVAVALAFGLPLPATAELTGEAPQLPLVPATPMPPTAEPARIGPAALVENPAFRGRRGWTVEPELPAPPPGTLTVTHSESLTLTAGHAVSCSTTRGATTTAASYLRHFTLTDFGIAGAFDVASVAFGVESLRGAPQTVTVNLYTLVDPAGDFGYDNFVPVGTADARLDVQQLTVVEVPVTGSAPAGSTLVVEVAVPDLRRGAFFPGAHPEGQTSPTYLKADACGIPQPVTTDALGVPQLQLLLTVTGVETPGCDERIVGVHPGPLTVTESVTCLAGARVQGEVNVLGGAGLVATSSAVQGPLATFGATVVELTATQITGPVSVRGTTGSVTLSGLSVVGSVIVIDNRTPAAPIVVAGSTIVGSLLCLGNEPPPTAAGSPNTVVGGLKLAQCENL